MYVCSVVFESIQYPTLIPAYTYISTHLHTPTYLLTYTHIHTQAKRLQNELSTIVNEFILKRGNILNAEHLPPKLVQVSELYVCMYVYLSVCVNPTS